MLGNVGLDIEALLSALEEILNGLTDQESDKIERAMKEKY